MDKILETLSTESLRALAAALAEEARNARLEEADGKVSSAE